MRRRTFISFCAFPFVLFIALWAVGLIFFASMINKPLEDFETKTDAIIVLTGGTQRLEEGLALLKQEKAEKLFISGVNEKVDLMALMKNIEELPEELTERITLGHIACNTHENALESLIWTQENDVKSLRLVTASYHMPRSFLEFKNAMPFLTIIPHPIFPETFKHNEWWKWRGTFSLINSEFLKYTFVYFTYLFSFNPRNVNIDIGCS